MLDPSTTLPQIQARIAAACTSAARDLAGVRLLAVSKFHPAPAIAAAYQAGQRDFGESYAQELAQKAESLAALADLRWHFIGPIQTNKIKWIAAHASYVHALESARAAIALDRALEARGRSIAAMVQVNVGGEAQKHGIEPAALPALLEATSSLRNLTITGLMTLPPASRPLADRAFAELAELAHAHQLSELSMGMSDDLDLAIARGATWVRVGSAIFGARS